MGTFWTVIPYVTVANFCFNGTIRVETASGGKLSSRVRSFWAHTFMTVALGWIAVVPFDTLVTVEALSVVAAV